MEAMNLDDDSGDTVNKVSEIVSLAMDDFQTTGRTASIKLPLLCMHARGKNKRLTS